MNSQTQLSATQAEILKVASYRPDGNIEPLPPALRGGARIKVINGLLSRALIEASTEDGGDRYVLTDAAFAAVGRKRKTPVATPQDLEVDATAAKDAGDEELAAELNNQRTTAMNGSFLRASLFTSVLAYGVSLMAIGVGVVNILVGWALLALGKPAKEA